MINWNKTTIYQFFLILVEFQEKQELLILKKNIKVKSSKNLLKMKEILLEHPVINQQMIKTLFQNNLIRFSGQHQDHQELEYHGLMVILNHQLLELTSGWMDICMEFNFCIF